MKSKLRVTGGVILTVLLIVFLTGCGSGGGGGGKDKESPAVPTAVTATNVSSSQIDLSWNPSTDNVGVTGYKIYRDGAYLKSVTTTSTSDTELSSDTHCYSVSAYDAASNESGQSSQSCATTFGFYYDKTKLLEGNWYFEFTIISTFSYEYSLTSISEDKNSQDGYYIYGTGEYGNDVIAAYWPDDEDWSLLDPGTIIDMYYVFYTDGNDILPNSCYYQIDLSDGSWSSCYSLSGYKTASVATHLASTAMKSKDKILTIEQMALGEATIEPIDDSIAEKYLILKSLAD